MAVFLGSVAMLLIASGWLAMVGGEPIWQFERRDLFVSGIFVAAFLLSSVLQKTREMSGFGASLVNVALCSVASVGSAIILLGLRNYSLSKQEIVLALCAGLLISSLGMLLREHRGLLVGALAAVVCAGLALHLAAGAGTFAPKDPGFTRKFIPSHLYGISATYYRLPALLKPGGGIPIPPRGVRVEPGGGIREGGGIIALPSGYLLVSGAGDFYLFDKPAPGAPLIPLELDIQVPINGDAFKHAVESNAAVRYWNFRVQDVQVHIRPEGTRVFVSHHYWHESRACYVVRVSSFESLNADLAAMSGKAEWETLFESKPCLPIKVFSRGQRFAGEESGGKLGLLHENTLLLTLGDHEFDGLNSEQMLAQDPNASYGKIIAIDIPSWKASVFSTGHRNPQGLFIAGDQSVWSTEHGPAGGDELNRINPGQNYGWPVATHGVDYGLTEWPLTTVRGSHEGYTQPIYAWVPSIGVSNLTGVEETKFAAWRGDLLVTSLRDRGMWRMRIRNGGLVVNERIDTDIRIRDIIEGKNGEIILWSDENPQIVFMEPAGDERPPEVVVAVCRACHMLSGDTSAIGPSLVGVVGRTIAALPKYQYSNGLRNKDGVWDDATLDAFLADPQGFAPGTSMALPGIKSAKERKVVIDYLRAL